MAEDRREQILLAVQALLKTIAPPTYRTNVGGRVYAKMRGGAKPDASELPALEVVTSAKTADAPTPLDDTLYSDDLHLEIAGYCKGTDGGDDKDAPVRQALNALRDDVIQSMAGLETFVPAGSTEASLRKRFGSIAVILVSTWTEPSSETSDGYVLLEYTISYLFAVPRPGVDATMGGLLGSGAPATVLLTAKGELLTHNGAGLAVLPVGANGEQIIADSTQPTGQRWGTPSVPAHTQAASTISDATAAGRALLTAADVPAQQMLLGIDAIPYRQIGRVVCSGGRTSVTFSAIPAGYEKIILEIRARSATAGTKNLHLMVNGDAVSTNYTKTQYIYNSAYNVASATTADPTAAGGIICTLIGSDNVADVPQVVTVEIIGYADVSFKKLIETRSSRYALSSIYCLKEFSTVGWLSYAAINELTITPSSGAFADGSVFVLCVAGITT